jgi:hypothetical protein
MTTRLLLLSLAIATEQYAVTSFSNPSSIQKRPPQATTNHHTSLSMAAGMGMGTTKKKDNKGMGKKSSSKDKKSASFDVAKSLIKSEKLYEELLTESGKAYANAEYEEDIIDITSEFVVAARAKPGTPNAAAAASDWIPVAQICIVRPIHGEDMDGELDPSVPTAVSYYCREIHHAACRASPSTFQSLPRNVIEYSVEPFPSFTKYVYEEVFEGKSSSGSIEEDGASVSMTKTKARELLGLEAGCKDPTLIKQAYKKLMFDLHPDRFVNDERTSHEITASSERFLSVKIAYEALTSGVRVNDSNGDSKSWYASLGGKSRTEFVGPIELLSMEKAGALCNKAFKAAVASVDPDVSMAFVTRNQAAAKQR